MPTIRSLTEHHSKDTILQAASNFAILGTQRTGTTLIRTSLDSHPDVLCCGEVFLLGKRPYSKADGFWSYSRQSIGNRMQAVFSPEKATTHYLEQLYSSPGYAAIGFKLMLGHCLKRPHIWTQLLDRNTRFILVRRRNLLKTLVSRRSASESGVYHISRTLNVKSAVDDWQARGVNLDPATVIDDLDAIGRENETWQARLSGNVSRIEVVYEDYTRDIGGENERILDFLGVRRLPLTSDLEKVNPDDLGQSIKNLDEVASALKNTRYEKFLQPQ